MGVLDRAKEMSGVKETDGNRPPYECLGCETQFEVQHHTCPVCGSFDVRRAEWIE